MKCTRCGSEADKLYSTPPNWEAGRLCIKCDMVVSAQERERLIDMEARKR